VREGEILSQLNHPNIVNMVAAVEDGLRHYLVMEYVQGRSLADLLRTEGPLPIARSVEITLDLSDALTRAHHLGVIHRDLKPANVLLTEDGTPRLADFGIALLADSARLTQTGVVMGTIEYLSPEACVGEKMDARVDIWALGVVLYEMLTGERPFMGEIPTATIAAILAQPLPDLSQRCRDAPDALVDLVHRMLEKDRHQRIPSVRLVGAELEAIVKGADIRLPHPSRPEAEDSRFATPMPPSADVPGRSLPAQTTPFVGRETELAELARLLGDREIRLVSILGPGGIGKTRLALEAAEAQLPCYSQNVYYVPLAPIQSVGNIVSAVADAIGFRSPEGGDPKGRLLSHLRQRRMLLVMDNFEHLGEGAGLVDEILRSAPGVKVLVTSREKLNLQGETRLRIEGLSVPDQRHDWRTPADALEYDAVVLFMQTARRARPGLELEAPVSKQVARICQLVGGCRWVSSWQRRGWNSFHFRRSLTKSARVSTF
jgi:non-specific serine/threonine protein kinase